MAFNNIDEILTIKEDNSPKQQINEQSLTHELEKNRESLKRKLQTRRSLQQLVEVGIIPSTKASVPFYEQRKQLQMRKTQDILKNKILSRPNRQLLIEHNILPDSTAAPAIQHTQCQLKRARLVDNLNDKLSVRPGILELVANNIFEIDSHLKQAIQDGCIQYPSLSQPLSIPNASKRSINSISKSKSCLTFHEYKGPTQKVEITKVPLQATNENHYGIQLRQQQLFLELIHNNKSIDKSSQQTPTSNTSQAFETMKLADLKNVCRKLNISSTGTKTKLIEKLKNAQSVMSDTTILSSQTPIVSSSYVTHSLSNELTLYQPEKPIELEKSQEYDTSLSYLHSIDDSTVIISLPTQQQILLQEQPSIVDSDAQFLVQTSMSDNYSSATNDHTADFLNDYIDSSSMVTFPSNDFYSNILNSPVLTHTDWMEVSSSNQTDNNSDLTQFLNPFDNESHHFLFDLFSPSSPMI